MQGLLPVTMLLCPGDTQRVVNPITDWSQASPDRISYQLVTPGVPETEREKIYVRCSVHGYVLFADGVAQKYPKRTD